MEKDADCDLRDSLSLLAVLSSDFCLVRLYFNNDIDFDHFICILVFN